MRRASVYNSVLANSSSYNELRQSEFHVMRFHLDQLVFLCNEKRHSSHIFYLTPCLREDNFRVVLCQWEQQLVVLLGAAQVCYRCEANGEG